MQLVDMDEDDLELRLRMEMDPAIMAELGGPNTREQVGDAHYVALEAAAAGYCWYQKIVDGSATIGFIGIWGSTFRGGHIYEMGWMVFPEFQGRGMATKAGTQLLQRNLTERKFNTIYAFPGVSNVPSNRICTKLGFTLDGESDIDYQGTMLRVNCYRLDAFE